MFTRIAVLTVAMIAIAGIAMAQTESTLKAEVQVCTSIVDRMPQGADTAFSATAGAVYCWSKITGATSGEATVTHVWLHEGTEVARVELAVRSVAWRTWSQKNLYGKTGNWEVRVTDSAGNLLGAAKFMVGE